MKALDIIQAAGDTALSIAFPGIWPAITGLINSFTSDESSHVGKDSAASTAVRLIERLPPEQQELLSQQIDVAIQRSKERMAISQDQVKMQEILERSSKRGELVSKMVTTLICFITLYGLTLLGCTFIQMYIVTHPEQYGTDINVFEAIPQWDAILAVLGTLIYCIRSYFGDRSADTANGLRAQLGHAPIVKQGLLSAVAQRITQKVS